MTLTPGGPGRAGQHGAARGTRSVQHRIRRGPRVLTRRHSHDARAAAQRRAGRLRRPWIPLHSAYSFSYVVGNRFVTFVANLLYKSWLSEFSRSRTALRSRKTLKPRVSVSAAARQRRRTPLRSRIAANPNSITTVLWKGQFHSTRGRCHPPPGLKSTTPWFSTTEPRPEGHRLSLSLQRDASAQQAAPGSSPDSFRPRG